MAEIFVSSKDHPVLCLIFPRRIELSDMEELGRKMEVVYSSAYARREALVVIVDASQLEAGGMAPEARVKLAKLGDESLQRYPGVRIAEAIVSRSPTVRALVKAHNLFRRKAVPQGVFSDVLQAKSWALSVLQQQETSRVSSVDP